MPTISRYRLIEEIGAGGMATVWRAVGPAERSVAVKIMRPELAQDQTYRDALRNEVHLTARLNHAGIVQLHAWGETTESEAVGLDRPAGTPWIAMDLADRQFDWRAVKSWDELLALANALLSALMHSHARGVIHRDLKPGNVLVVQTDRPRFLITDFGIAFPHRTIATASPEVHPMAGTLTYMAPEQLLGRWRDFGSYTDLFSLGVLLFQTASGRLPFPAQNRIELAMQHQRGAPALGQTRFAVPSGFEEWVGTLMSFDPRDRFAFAADAAHGLALLGEPLGDRNADEVADRSQEVPTLAWPATRTELPGVAADGSWAATLHIGGPLRAPVREDWRDQNAARTERVAVGLDLFGVRRAPMTGREAERDIAWNMLLRTLQTGRGHGLILRGCAGVGKSALAQWLCDRAHELGLADSTRLVHSSGTATLPDLLTQVFRLTGLTESDARMRIQEILEMGDDDPDLLMLQHLLEGTSAGLGEQTMLLGRILGYFTSHRPTVIWLDDAHWSLEAIEAANTLTDIQVPVLFVLTVREEDLRSLPIQEAQLANYARRESVEELPLQPLGEHEMASLLDESLALAPELRADLVGQSRGNPLHALQALQLAVRSGHTQLSDEGLVGGVIPRESTDELWFQRLAAAGREGDPALLAAAVLGYRVEPRLWFGVCERLGIEADITLAHELVEAGLWTPIPNGWIFAHGSLRDALLARAAGTMARRDAHRAAAALLDPNGTRTFIAHGFHRISAGDVDGGVDVLVDGLALLYAEARVLTARSVIDGITRLELDLSAETRAKLERASRAMPV